MVCKEDTITNKVKVSRVIYHNATNNWGVFTYENDGRFPELSDAEVKVSGNFEYVSEGTELEISGTIVSHPTYGLQINLKTSKVVSNSTSREGIIDFLTKSSISGIAYANAEKIYNRFGKDSIHIVLHETERIMEISGIGEGTYLKVKASVDKYLDQEELVNFCNEIGGVPYSLINTLFNIYGKDAVNLLKEDPYKLLDGSELSFKQIDNIGLKMGIPVNHDSRLKAGMVSILYEETAFRGSTGCNSQELQRIFLKTLGLTDASLYQYTLNILEEDNRIVVEYNTVFLIEYYMAEQDIAEYLKGCRKLTCNTEYSEFIIDEEIHNFPFELNTQQIDAIRSCLKNRFSVITSAAGAGKSTITKAIVKILDRHGEELVLLSPTGKAAKRLNECTGYETSTIHRFLGRMKDEVLGFKTTVIIDEASMVDVLLFRSVLALTNSDTRIILVGDTHQLPSVQAGNILEDIISSKMFNVCTLTDVMRQAENSNIIKFCNYVNEDKSLTPIKSKDFIYLNFNSRESIINHLIPLYKKAVEKVGLQETQVLCAYKMGQVGVKALNSILKQEINNRPENDKFPFSVGDKVKHIKNNYKKNVFNGETGIVSKIELAEDIKSLDVLEDTLQVNYGDRFVEYTKTDINELQLSYASTVHASQGSEYKVVFVILDNEVNNFLLIRKIIYTALSRAKSMCVLLSTGNCVNTAIHNDYYKERNTKLRDFLCGEFEDDDLFD